MGPSTPRQSTAAVSRAKLAGLTATFAVGAFLGYGFASTSGTAFGSIAALIIGLITLGVLAVMAVIAAILALAPDKSGRQAARAIVVAGAVLVVGVVVGWAVTPAFRSEYRESVVLDASGTMNLSLEGIDGYTAEGEAPAACHSELDAEAIASIGADVVGRIGTAVVGASMTPLTGSPDGPPAVTISVRPSVEDKGSAPFWQGPADEVEVTDGGRGGRIAFSRAAFTEPDATPPNGYPSELSGTLSWSCGEWLRSDGPTATPR